MFTITPSYTPPCSSSTMTATLPHSLPRFPHDLLSSWSTWRQPKTELLTPPPSGSAEHRRTLPRQHSMVLPPIGYLERIASSRHASPRDHTPRQRSPVRDAPLPPLKTSSFSQDSGLSCDYADYVRGKPATPVHVSQPIDWFGPTQKHSYQFLAEKTCEMICYLWFSTSLAPASPNSSPVESTPAVNSLQLSPSCAFVNFLQKVLETTQVSESVIVLSLHYIYRLKERNRLAHGQPGSEFRVCVAALMLANKFVDDNTYTNKTWSEVSGIGLLDINQMEREYLKGLDFQLYVDKAMYDSWLKLLKGLVMTKERALRELQHTHRARRVPAPSAPRPLPSTQHSPTSARAYERASARKVSHGSGRARSSSPYRAYRPPAPALPTHHQYEVAPQYAPATAYTSGKRSAAEAFSPTSATFSESRPMKRPIAMALEIPAPPRMSPARNSPVDPMTSFANLSLAASVDSPMQLSSANYDAGPRTLVASYRMDPTRQPAVPQNLYYYSLSSSPTERPYDAMVDDDDRANRRRARLRSHQTAQSNVEAASPAWQQYAPQVVQSARSSPRDVRLPVLPPLALPSAATWGSGYPFYAAPILAGGWDRGRTM